MRIPCEIELAGIIHDAADCLDDVPANYCSWAMATAAAKAVHELLQREKERAKAEQA